MTFYHACTGCELQGMPCDMRENLRSKLAGIGVTSIKWKCALRTPRFKVGQPVWANVYVATEGSEEDGRYVKADFPGTVCRLVGSKALVFIKPEARSDCDDYEFQPKGNGFCKIPLSRLKPRDGEAETICPSCEQPASLGHIDGYRCALPVRDYAPPAECPF